MSELSIKCPCCEAKIVVDTQLGQVIGHEKKQEAIQSFQDFLSAEKGKKAEIDQLFADSKKKEDGKQEYLQKKFDWARKNKDKLPPEKPEDRIFWD
jgi:hypothetical protein